MLNKPRPLCSGLMRAIPVAVLAMALACGSAQARHHYRVNFIRGASLTDPAKDAALMVDGSSGKVLFARNADALRHPASLTKMMTLYLLFDALRQGKVTLASTLTVSPHASVQKPTNLHLLAGDQLTVDTAIKAIVVRSANDVAVTIAEGIGGTESHFAELMTQKARDLGMRSTYYHNASGLPDPLQITTASDLAILAHHLAYDFPQYYHYFSIPSFTYRGITYPTHDNLIGRYEGADGIKTGYTGMSGFNLVSSVVRGGQHVIGVVMGGRTAHMRDRAMVNLLDQTFAQAAQNPTLIARTQVPWQTVAQNTVSPITINAATQTSSSPPLVSPTTTSTGPALAMATPQPNTPAPTDDEETAEAKTSEGNADLTTHAGPLVPTAIPNAAPLPQGPLVAANASTSAPPLILPAPKPPSVTKVAQLIKPKQKPAEPVAGPVVVATANAPKPIPKPALSVAANDSGEGDISDEHAPAVKTITAATAPVANPPAAKMAGPSAPVKNPPAAKMAAVATAPTSNPPPATNWIIQIGAFPNQALAQAQLAAYAHRSTDILGKAAQSILPGQAFDGHTVFRARFGPFPEREARDVCNRLTQRGQTCFAAVATR